MYLHARMYVFSKDVFPKNKLARPMCQHWWVIDCEAITSSVNKTNSAKELVLEHTNGDKCESIGSMYM